MSGFPLDHVSENEVVSVSHDFVVSSDELLAAFTSRDLFLQWYPPRGWSVQPDTVTFEPQRGGRVQLAMKHESELNVFAPVYLRFESISLEGLELVESIAGPMGEPTDHLMGIRIGFVPGTVITSSGVGEGITVKVEVGPLPEQVHDDVAATWKGSLTKLEEVLSS
ncbi:hypothetical protein ACN08Z_06895 [Rothia sp. P7181]|uniref:hypothetical protein n=1 Tax=Rothia sp. P7181 TaxID=3402663 RepID=UPI003AECD91B